MQILLRTALPVALAHIVTAGHAENAFARLLRRHVLGPLPDHHHQLTFVVHVLGAGRDHDGVARVLQRADGLIKDLRTFRRRTRAQVALVIQPDCQDLRRLDWMQQLHLAEFMLLARFGVLAQQIAVNLVDCLAIQDPVSSR